MQYQYLVTKLRTLRAHGAFGFVLALGLLVNQPVHAAESVPEVSPEGLKLVPKTKVAVVYLREGADFSGYSKVAILDCYVAFKKDWKRDQNSSNHFKVGEDDVARIKTELAEEFKKVFSKQLTAKGETVVPAPGPGVLVLRPAIVNLDAYAPDTSQATPSRSYSAAAGMATLFLELYDSSTGELLMRVIDTREAGTDGFVTVRNGVTNRADAQRLLARWADQLGVFLAEARSVAATGAEPAKEPTK
jgi:Protein of unknown function (DUF3313)